MTQIAVNIAMFALMFGMGLTLVAADFKRIAKTPAPTLIGTLLQLVLMPIFGIALAKFFALPPLLAAGLVVLAALPGGMFSNIYVHLAKGNTALSVTLTATATLVTLFTLPLWIRVALTLGEGAATAAPLDMPVLETAAQLGLLTVVPVGLGMGARHRWPESVRWERKISLPCFLIIILGVASQAATRPEPPTEALALSWLPVLLYTVGGLAGGLLLPALFGISAKDAVTMTVELVVKNTLLGLVLLSKALDFEAVVPLLVFMVLQTPAGFALLLAWRYAAKRGWVAPVDGPVNAAESPQADGNPA